MIKPNAFRPKTAWQRIFLQSKVNGAPYEEQEWNVNWPSPEDTYLKRRLSYLRCGRSQKQSSERLTSV